MLIRPVTLALLLATPIARALPQVDKYVDLSRLANGEDPAIVFADHENPDVAYVPYDRVKIALDPDTQRPAFGFVFNEDGGLMNFMVSATYSDTRRATIAALQQSGKLVRPLPIVSGGWAMTVTTGSQSFFLGVTDKVSTVLPDVPVAFSVQMSRNSIAYLAAALRTGATVGINYKYAFRGATEPSFVRGSVNFFEFHNYLQTANVSKGKNCVEGTNVSGSNQATWEECGTPTSELRQIVKTAVEGQTIRIVGYGDASSEERARMIKDMTDMIQSRMFKPQPTRWQPIERDVDDPVCNAGGTGWYNTWCSGNSSLSLINSETSWENRWIDIEIVSQGVATFDAAVGFSFAYLCERHPSLIRYVQGLRSTEGCPTLWDGGGLQQAGQGGPGLGTPRPDAPVTPPPVVPNF
jgi:hypothetical protein